MLSDSIYLRIFSKGKVIYQQTMTPTWLEAHASYIDSSRKVTPQQLTFNAGAKDNAALLKVPMIPSGVLKAWQAADCRDHRCT